MNDEEVIIKKPNVLGDERHIHPSFGMLSFNRISGGSPYLYGSSIKHHDKIQLVFDKEEIKLQIPYQLVCETFSSSYSNSGSFKRKLKEVFSVGDLEKIKKLVKFSKKWSLTKGVPDVYVCDVHDFNLWKKLEVFCRTYRR